MSTTPQWTEPGSVCVPHGAPLHGRGRRAQNLLLPARDSRSLGLPLQQPQGVCVLCGGIFLLYQMRRVTNYTPVRVILKLHL